MKPSEAAMILTKISAYDRRTIGDADAEAWAEALDGQVTIKDALTAIRDHFRESSDWLMPNMVIERARKIRRLRVREIGQPDVPSGLTAAQEREWVRVFWETIHEIPQPTMQDGTRAADRALDIRDVASVMVPPERVKDLIAEVSDGKAMPALAYDRPRQEWF